MQTVKTLAACKHKQKIAMLTAYDYYGATQAQEAGVDVILVGDSLGMVVLGYPSTLHVEMTDMTRHSAAVRRGADDTFIVTDLPYGSYHISTEQAKANAFDLVRKGLANAVKLEGAHPERLQVITAITQCEIPVVAHLGLTPQSVNAFGGYKIQGKTKNSGKAILEQALRIQDAGAFMLVLEGIPEHLGKEITATLQIPTIGIGAGRYCDGQVLVWHDMLGISGAQFKFVKEYDQQRPQTIQAIKNYCQQVRNGQFPDVEHVYKPVEDK